MHSTDPALAIDNATRALYATASEPYRPRTVKTIVVLMIVAVALLAMFPVFASSMQPASEQSSVPAQQAPVTVATPEAAPGAPAVYATP